ncbi:MAG: hypothetical protein H6509_03985 [Bryobacterales bacterium]|nr:hypothetical protein [Acidobacteriota bacterium]MCB9383751.1 hypothetical protein [Bryobacterales bacterium]
MQGLRAIFDPATWRPVRPKLDPHDAVLRIEHRTPPLDTKLRAIVGGVILAAAAAAGYLGRGETVVVLVACGFGLFALLNLLIAVLNAGYRVEIALRPDEVVYNARWMGRQKEWREPLERYRGVRLREEQLRNQGVGNLGSTQTRFWLELAHADASKTVPLYFQAGGAPPRERQEAFAERFRLPVLLPDGEDEIAAGAAPAAADPGPPPPGVRVETEGESTRIVIGSGRGERRLTVLIWLSFPVIVGLVAYRIEPLAGWWAAGLAAVLALAILGLGRLMQGKDGDDGAICLSAERIWVERPRGGGEWMDDARTAFVGAFGPEAREESLPLESMPRAAVEQVRLDVYTSRNSDASVPHARLLIEARAGRLEYIGTQFDRAKLEWVRDYLRYVLRGG